MRHVPDGSLRRLIDEPFVVADRVADHLAGCSSCRARAERIADNAAVVERFFAAPERLDVDAALSRSSAALATDAAGDGGRPLRPARHWRVMGASLSTGASVAAVGVVLAGVAAAATLTTVFAPTQVVPVPVSQADMHELSQLLGYSTSGSLGGFGTPSGSDVLAFGTLSWTSSGRSTPVGSLAAAEAATGLEITLPTTLPNGVGTVDRFVVMPKLTATITFAAAAGSTLAGSTLTVSLGPAVAVSYRGATMFDGVGPLGIVTVAQPVATSNGATTTEIEDFLLAQPGVPADLAAEIRLLGNLETTLPIPAPPGTSTESTEVDGSRAVVLVDNSNAASGAIWAGADGVVHVVAGLIDKEDLLSVAQQIG